MSFDALGLSPELLRAVSDEGYTEPTPVQREAIPLVLARRDMLAGAQTGTGKTAAFVLPIIQILHETRVAPPAGTPSTAAQVSPALRQRGRNSGAVQQASRSTPATSRPPIRVLVVVPTRELCIQVEESVRTYGARRPIKSTTIYGGVGFEPQAAKLRGGPEIVVATPGRLLDHVSQRTIDLWPRRDPGPGRGRPPPGHGLHPRHPQDHRPPPAEAAEPDVLRHVLGRRPGAGRRHPGDPGLRPGHAAEHDGRARRPARDPRGPRAQARPAP